MDVIKRQTRLQSLDLKSNYFSTEQTNKLLAFLIDSECTDTIEDLNLMFTADLSSTEGCKLILLLIDRALSLKKCNIKQNDENDKRVFVEVKYAQGSD